MQRSNTRLLVLVTAYMEDVSGVRCRAWALMVPAEDGREAPKEENENAAFISSSTKRLYQGSDLCSWAELSV